MDVQGDLYKAGQRNKGSNTGKLLLGILYLFQAHTYKGVNKMFTFKLVCDLTKKINHTRLQKWYRCWFSVESNSVFVGLH